MAQTLQAVFISGEQERVDYVPSGTIANGEIVALGTNLTGVCTTVGGLVSGQQGSLAISGKFRILKANSVVTFARGALVDWDDTNNLAVATTTGTFKIGTCLKAAVATDDGVEIWLNREVVD